MKTEIYMGVLAIVVISLLLYAGEVGKDVVSNEPKVFNSESELLAFLQSNEESGIQTSGMARTDSMGLEAAPTAAAGDTATNGAKSSDYSETNIQVEGVDEADIIKTDGNYIYTVSGNYVVIVDASELRTVSMINMTGTNVQNIYVNGDRLVVLGNNYNYYYGGIGILKSDVAEGSTPSLVAVDAPSEPAVTEEIATDIAIVPPMPPSREPSAYIRIYDVTDRANPVLARNFELNGSHYESRMVGDYVYAIINAPVSYQPRSGGAFPEIYYFDTYDYSYQFTNIVSVNVLHDEVPKVKTFLLGYSNNLYVSEDNVYMVYQKHIDPFDTYERIVNEVLIPSVPEDVADDIRSTMNSDKEKYEKQRDVEKILRNWIDSLGPEQGAQTMKELDGKYSEVQMEISKEMEKSVIHKVSINDGNIEYVNFIMKIADGCISG